MVSAVVTQVSTEKFARYFDVEARLVPVEEGYWVMHPERALEMVDENTIGARIGFHAKKGLYIAEVVCPRAVVRGRRVRRLRSEHAYSVEFPPWRVYRRIATLETVQHSGVCWRALLY